MGFCWHVPLRHAGPTAEAPNGFMIRPGACIQLHHLQHHGISLYEKETL